MCEKEQREKRGNCERELSLRDVVFRCLFFFVGLRDVPKIVRVRDFPLGFPLVYERSPKKVILIK